MRYGRSLLLGLVEAEAITYADTRQRLITCPACAEAVVKVERMLPGGAVSHYLRHYREASTGRARRCDLRAASVTASQVAAARAEARGQALALFVARFQACLDRVALDVPGLSVILRRMADRPRWRAPASDLQAYMHASATNEHERHWVIARDAAGRTSSLVWRDEIAVHARGMMAHALAPGSGRQFLYLLGTATVLAHLVVAVDMPNRPGGAPWPERVRVPVEAALRAFVHGSDTAVTRALRRWQAVPDPEGDYPDLRERVLNLLIQQCYVVLHAVPYAAIRQEAVHGAEGLCGAASAAR